VVVEHQSGASFQKCVGFAGDTIDGQTLMDGAIARNSPIRVAADLGASRIVVLPTGYACSLKELPKGAIARVLHAITLLIEWRLIHDIERLADEIEVAALVRGRVSHFKVRIAHAGISGASARSLD